MKILGIDPGMAIVGYGLIETVNDSINLLTSGSIQTDKKLPDSKRLPVAEARGVILTVLEKLNIPTYSYTPIQVKQVLTGYGRAEKKEVEQMVRLTLQSDKLPKLDDTVDAIAIAICHSRGII